MDGGGKLRREQAVESATEAIALSFAPRRTPTQERYWQLRKLQLWTLSKLLDPHDSTGTPLPLTAKPVAV
jgi:hypothetical protein